MEVKVSEKHTAYDHWLSVKACRILVLGTHIGQGPRPQIFGVKSTWGEFQPHHFLAHVYD